MEQIKCVIVDDEPLALDILEDYVGKVPFLKLVQRCDNAVKALNILQKEKIDLLFIDIKMPDITGIQLVKSLKNKPLVVFTTAYKEYAYDGFELDVIDYLLKPIEFDRFLKTSTKAFELLFTNKSDEPTYIEKNDANYLFVKSDYKLVKIMLNDIIYVEGLNDYIKINTRTKPIVTLMTMKYIEEKLPINRFIRVHRSFIVAIDKIESVSNHRIIIGDKYIPISAPYRSMFYTIIKQNS